jgi:hypothetical protein
MMPALRLLLTALIVVVCGWVSLVCFQQGNKANGYGVKGGGIVEYLAAANFVALGAWLIYLLWR